MQDWISTLVTLSPDSVSYLDFVEEGRRLALSLKVSRATARMVPTQRLAQHKLNLAASVSSLHSNEAARGMDGEQLFLFAS